MEVFPDALLAVTQALLFKYLQRENQRQLRVATLLGTLMKLLIEITVEKKFAN